MITINPKKPQIPLLFRFIRWLVPKLEKLNPKLVEKLAVAIFLRPLRVPNSSKGKLIEAKALQFKSEVNGTQIHTYQWGEGPFILMVHGWSSRASQFHTLIQELIDSGFSVLAFDNYGHGKSEGHKSSVLYIRDNVKFFCDKYEIRGIISHSLGSGGALFAIKENGFKIKTIIIAPPVTTRAIIDTFMLKIKAKKDLKPAFDDYCIKYYDAPFNEFTSEFFAENLHEFPLLLIHDRKDRDSPLSESELLAEKLPFAEFVITEKLGHNRILHDEAVISKIKAFLN